MQLTNIISIIFFAPATSMAATDPDCLNHLGGAFSGVECYNGLSNDIAEENKILTNKIIFTIPKDNKNKIILIKYNLHKTKSKQYCSLSRDSYTSWVSEKHPTNPRYYDFDVVYHECIYNALLEQHKFLRTILKNSSQ